MEIATPQLDSHRWRWQDIDFGGIEHARVHHDELLFYLLTSASFIEIAADLYTRNLIEHYDNDPLAAEWLARSWEREEIQHGYALREYVRHVWPAFDWDGAYRQFFAEYASVCTLDELEPGKAREMAARCVVEMGTSTFYSMLASYTEEPVLKEIVIHIKKDEVTHYKNFYQLYSAYNSAEKLGKIAIIKTLFKRFAEAQSEDALIAFKHVYQHAHPDDAFKKDLYTRFVQESNRNIIRPHYPYKMAVRMLLNVIDLNRWLRRLSEPVLILFVRGYFFR
jgi:hypothetical protein